MAARQGHGGSLLEEVVIVGGLLLVQCVLAGYVVFVDHLLRLGAHPLAVIVVAGVTSAAFFLPFAVLLERKRWPSKVSGTLVAQFVLIALGGTTAFQELMLLGIKKTTPAVASAMPNLSPGLIFIVAACFRLERFDKACKYTQAKLVGTLVCLLGAMAMSLLHDVQSQSPSSSSSSYLHDNDWMLGCSYLVVAAIALALVTVLQAATLASFPAPLTMFSITSAMGAAFTAILQVILEGSFDIGPPNIIDTKLIAGIAILGGVVAGACMVFQTWCLGRKGPLFVSVFGPVQMVCSAILSASPLFRFRQTSTLSMGSLAGMVLMFSGLYIVLWAKRNETLSVPHHHDDEADDAEKAPLLLS